MIKKIVFFMVTFNFLVSFSYAEPNDLPTTDKCYIFRVLIGEPTRERLWYGYQEYASGVTRDIVMEEIPCPDEKTRLKCYWEYSYEFWSSEALLLDNLRRLNNIARDGWKVMKILLEKQGRLFILERKVCE